MGFLFHRADSRTVKGAEMSEWLTDKEKRILFSALTREKSVCIQVDKQCEPREPYEQSLQSVCESLEHKFYYDRLFKQMKKQIREEAIDDFVKAIICELKNKHTDMPIVDIFGSREKWKEKNSQYLECENLAYKIAEQLKEKSK